MPFWSILKSSKKKKRAAHKVHFSENGEERSVNSNSSNSLESDASSSSSDHDANGRVGGHPNHRGHHSRPLISGAGHVQHADINHNDIEDEEERRCLKHLDQLGLALENTYKEVESIDAYVRKLRYDFDHEMVPERRFMTCMCSAKIARAACCKKQIEVWHQLQHDIQETCCHHHPHSPDSFSHPHHHHHHHNNHHHLNHHHHQHQQQCGEVSMMTEEADSSLSADSDALSISTVSSGQDLGTTGFDTTDVVLHHVQKMVLFDVVRQRLDPSSVDSRTFLEHWILHVRHADCGGGGGDGDDDSSNHSMDDMHHF